jgi:hypothetical protein
VYASAKADSNTSQPESCWRTMTVSGKLWIAFGVLALAFSGFAIPYGFYLNGKEKSPESATETLPTQTSKDPLSQKSDSAKTTNKNKSRDHTTIQNNSVGGDLVVGTKNIINQIQSTHGNLKDRTIALYSSILEELHSRGWGDREQGIPGRIPKTQEEQDKWSMSLSSFFIWKFFNEVKNIRNEFYLLHIVDKNLENEIQMIEIIKLESIEETNEKGKSSGKGHRVLPQSIESIAFALKNMSDQLK